jgi:hypothetical protein
VQSAQYILGRFGPDSELRRWGLKLAASGGKRGKKRAIVAVARKLAVCCTACGATGNASNPSRKAAAGGIVVPQAAIRQPDRVQSTAAKFLKKQESRQEDFSKREKSQSISCSGDCVPWLGRHRPSFR